jgi:rod shape-determining protein MreC
MMRKKVFVLVVLILIALFLLFSKRQSPKLEEGLTAVIYLPAKVLAKTTSHPRETLSQGEERLLLELERENERLRRLLKLKERLTHRSLAALVIGREPTNWFNTILLDKGREVGVEENFIVITPEGLVGRVNKVHRNSCQVLLITDPESEIGALIERSRFQGVIQGRKRDLILKYLPFGADVKEVDMITTSGLD